MNQQESTEEVSAKENIPDSSEENMIEQTTSQKIDKIPVESIGSYGRIEETTEEESSESSSKTPDE